MLPARILFGIQRLTLDNQYKFVYLKDSQYLFLVETLCEKIYLMIYFACLLGFCNIKELNNLTPQGKFGSLSPFISSENAD